MAAEVKDLAQETTKATEDISRRVEAIQTDTTAAVTAIQGISQIIARINDAQTTIASAVEEQTATTNEMARHVADAAESSEQIAANISSVAAAAQTTTGGAEDARQAAADLAHLSEQFDALVGRSVPDHPGGALRQGRAPGASRPLRETLQGGRRSCPVSPCPTVPCPTGAPSSVAAGRQGR